MTPSQYFFGALLGVCLGLAGVIIVEPSAGWEDLRTRLANHPIQMEEE